MKIIVSHDVDHLYGKDHWFRDMIYPKLWVRSLIWLIKRKITFKEFFLRCISCFKGKRHRLEEVMAFDRAHGVDSVFFFGMNQGLGMSYRPDEARPMIQKVKDEGFLVGVHGIEYTDAEKIKKEKDTFTSLMGFEPDGIRMHYVRFDENTFENIAKAGYAFDSTEFDKPNNGTVKAPYKVGEMWEFPLAVMDGYLTQELESAKRETLARLEECKAAGLEYACVLFHDYQMCDDYKQIRDWYVWLIEYLDASEEYSFISYRDAVKELEG